MIRRDEARSRPRILFVAEAVTLAHFARIIALAKTVDETNYEVVIASDPRYLKLEQPFPFSFNPIRSIPSSVFNRALAQGKPLYDVKTLKQYVEDDLALLDAVKPDLVIGDFRLSLSISAPLRNLPYAAVVNAYWSPFADINYPVPDLPITRIFGVSLAQRLFNLVRPVAFALHASSLNKVRRYYGLSSLGHDLRSIYTWADFTLYADIPEAVPMHKKPDSHFFLGPLLWSARVPLPRWWSSLPEDRPIAFVTLGSSGPTTLLPEILQALAELPLTVVAATAEKNHITYQPQNIFVTDYLPIDKAINRSHLVVSNGGSLTTYQAFSAGIPVIGVTTNMDQLLNMQAVERLDAGIKIRAQGTQSSDIRDLAVRILNDARYDHAAKRIAALLNNYDPAQRFQQILTIILQ